MLAGNMTVMVSMLRGVNVGGHNPIKMDALRAVYERLGLGHVRTFVQSGNVVFTTDARETAALGTRIESAIERTFGFRPTVVLRTAAELRDVVNRNPFTSHRDLNASKLQVMFLAGELTPEARQKVLQLKPAPEELILLGRELFVYYPNGMGKSKLTGALLEKTLGCAATARNWNTVTKLLEMAEGTAARA